MLLAFLHCRIEETAAKKLIVWRRETRNIKILLLGEWELGRESWKRSETSEIDWEEWSIGYIDMQIKPKIKLKTGNTLHIQSLLWDLFWKMYLQLHSLFCLRWYKKTLVRIAFILVQQNFASNLHFVSWIHVFSAMDSSTKKVVDRKPKTSCFLFWHESEHDSLGVFTFPAAYWYEDLQCFVFSVLISPLSHLWTPCSIQAVSCFESTFSIGTSSSSITEIINHLTFASQEYDKSGREHTCETFIYFWLCAVHVWKCVFVHQFFLHCFSNGRRKPLSSYQWAHCSSKREDRRAEIQD